jgi:hypothetical protein
MSIIITKLSFCNNAKQFHSHIDLFCPSLVLVLELLCQMTEPIVHSDIPWIQSEKHCNIWIFGLSIRW